MGQFSPLHDHCILHTREKVDSHALIANELSDHFLTWNGSVIDTRLCKLDTPRLSLYSLQYGSAVNIYPAVYDQFSLVHFSLCGGIEVTADGNLQNVPQGRVLVSTPKTNINLRWSHDSEQLILRLPHELTYKVAHDMGQMSLHEEMLQSPGFVIPVEASELWRSQLAAFVGLEKGKRRIQGLEAWLSHIEQGIAMFLLLQFSPSVKGSPTNEDVGATLRCRKQLQRLYAFAYANLDKPITLTAMARAAALSERQLNTLCHSEFGLPPMAWLRGMRLDAIRDTLRTDPTNNLADIAMLHGFFHLGRFAAFYRQRFGELPRQTRKTATNG